MKPKPRKHYEHRADGTVVVTQVETTSVSAHTKAKLNAALLYAARCRLDSPRIEAGTYGGKALANWFERMVLHAEAHPSADADEFLEVVTASEVV